METPPSLLHEWIHPQPPRSRCINKVWVGSTKAQWSTICWFKNSPWCPWQGAKFEMPGLFLASPVQGIRMVDSQYYDTGIIESMENCLQVKITSWTYDTLLLRCPTIIAQIRSSYSYSWHVTFLSACMLLLLNPSPQLIQGHLAKEKKHMAKSLIKDIKHQYRLIMQS